MIRRGFFSIVLVLILAPAASWGQSPRFASCNANAVAGILIVSGQIVGLGNQMRPPTPLHLEATVTAVCLDPTTSPATVVGTETVSDAITYPPKNGNRKFGLVISEGLVLPCDPPFEIAVGIVVQDTTHNIECRPLLPPAPEPEPEPEPEPAPEPPPLSQ